MPPFHSEKHQIQEGLLQPSPRSRSRHPSSGFPLGSSHARPPALLAFHTQAHIPPQAFPLAALCTQSYSQHLSAADSLTVLQGLVRPAPTIPPVEEGTEPCSKRGLAFVLSLWEVISKSLVRKACESVFVCLGTLGQAI